MKDDADDITYSCTRFQNKIYSAYFRTNISMHAVECREKM